MIEQEKIIKYYNKESESIDFINWRFIKKDYRGMHISQHNRWSISKFNSIIKQYINLEKEYIEIPPGDFDAELFSREYKRRYEDYILLCINLKKDIGSGSFNSVKKNMLPDLFKMKVIQKYKKDENGSLIEILKKKKKFDYITLNKVFLKEYKITNINKVFSKWSKNMYIDILAPIFTIANHLNNKKILFDEFWLFVTFLNKKDKNQNLIDEYKIINLIKNYRMNEKGVKKSIINNLKIYSKLTLKKNNKTKKMDIQNLKNQSQQILTHLKKAYIFNINEKNWDLEILTNNKLQIKSKQYKRSATAKEEYFKNHKIKDKIMGFELDHIVPISWKTDFTTAVKLDNWKNLIYIDAFSHAKKTQNNNLNSFFNKKNQELYSLTTFPIVSPCPQYNSKNIIILKKDCNIKFNSDLFEELKKYNDFLHKEIK